MSSHETDQAARDTADLERFGYKQELKRDLGTFSSFAVAFSYISPSTGIFTLFALGLTTIGGVFIWSWQLVALGQFCIALGFAELLELGVVLARAKVVRGRPTGDPAQPVVQGSTPVPPRVRRRTDSPTTPSPGRPDRRAGAATVARVRWIPLRDSLMQHPLRQAGAMVHEPTRVPYDGCQANPSDLGRELK